MSNMGVQHAKERCKLIKGLNATTTSTDEGYHIVAGPVEVL